ncbi:hypothetical protein [Thiococcus pfennigii]|jgi:hypothetical protein|uniref:hypothetical protein n=1 Tax=Thiococcus pfennigii TaxID=1057 RepID=UPI001908F786|nr:hypothetical protein [Thiococcus pfennigii]MBK1699443.1 hypothetical protein [Thiococcus pfennigii]MBK1732907.1 hypothetical protein [Thiococcus pfennigii]
MNRSARLACGLVAGLWLSTAVAHTPLCSCYDNGDGTLLCEGGFSDGSSAAGVDVRVVDADGGVILEGKMNENSEFELDRPDGDFTIVFDAGPGHAVEIPASAIY